MPKRKAEDTTEDTTTTSAVAGTRGERYTPAELEWLRAVEAYQKRHRRKFLAHVDYLRVALGLGYRPPQDTPPAGEQELTPPAG